MAAVTDAKHYTSYARGRPVAITQRARTITLDDPLPGTQQHWHWDATNQQLSAGRHAHGNGLLPVLDSLFGRDPQLAYVSLKLPQPLQARLAEQGIVQQDAQGGARITPAIFWQLGELWLGQRNGAGSYPQQQVVNADGQQHPRRPDKRTGTLYRRYIPWLDQSLSFRTLDRKHDLERFQRWMHHPRVSEFWQQAHSLQALDNYLRKLEADRHSQTLIACFDERPFAYFEVYWAREDRLGPFYAAHDYDRGWHVLVGEDDYRGRAWFSAWFPSLQHYLFLDDARTQRLVAEPRHDNDRLLRYAQKVGFENIKTFDFPHKRAQLIMLSREHFFQHNNIHPAPATPGESM